jgi:hypothetical protein
MGALGGFVAAGLSTPLAMLVRSHIAKNIEDPGLRAEFEGVTVKRALFDSIKNAIAGEFVSTCAVWLAKEGYTVVQEMLAGAGSTMGLIGT